MNRTTYLILFTLFFVSCGKKKEQILTTGETPLYSLPVAIPLDTTSGYDVHLIDGDSAQGPLPGVVSGRTIALKGKILISDSLRKTASS